MEKDLRSLILFLLPAIVILAGGLLFYFFVIRNTSSSQLGRVPDAGGIEIEERAEQLLKNLGVSRDSVIELMPINTASYPDALGAVGWSKDGDATLITVTATLPDAQPTQTYMAWLVGNDASLLLGTLHKEKAGYILDVSKTLPLQVYTQVVVSLETNNDTNIEQRILEGNATF